MANRDGELTLGGLARTLRDHMDASAAEFARVQSQFAQVGVRIDELRSEIGTVATIVRDLTQIVGRHHDELRGEIGTVATTVLDLTQVVARHHDELTDHRSQLEEQRRQAEDLRQYVRQVFSRMEQSDARMAEHDARFEGMTRDIRRILDAIERRGGDGGRRDRYS